MDVGCGYGRIAKYLLPKRSFDGYIGLDLSSEMLRLFRKNLANWQIQTPVMLLQSLSDHIPIKSESVDNVITITMLLHNPKFIVYRIIVEIYRILKPGGIFIALSSFPNQLTFSGIQGLLYTTMLAACGQGNRNGPVRYFTEREVRNLFKMFSSIHIIRSGFDLLPKSIIGLPSFINSQYRKRIWRPISNLGEKYLPLKFQSLLCKHFDVIAIK